MICQVCIIRNDATHGITYKGDELIVCDACFENRPDDAIPWPEQPEQEIDPMQEYWQRPDDPGKIGDWILSELDLRINR